MEETKTETTGEERKLPEKPIEKMTAPELRELAKGFGVEGTHAMKKEELIPIIKEAYGIKDEGLDKKSAKSGGKTVTVRAVKERIAKLKKDKAAALEAGDRKKRDILRRRINRDKKRSRRAVHA
ncbi:MAG: Rho termination protein [Deltaproteobacteria bacterium CG_4_8_14_3_um_filter_51_11]|nr:transcription termination factor Rho [bacterium]OIP42077.1 MAG: hypothetical protein AUK25_04520 [Desulfobacteraceae bacterium CG2_30_51_40]PIP45529.1 MAG: Rho termination protein [Deltaproteobacteria bacterium CG23_combo_of_CG06-09_8_20_14_all_51_20]PIX20657.1 MAG: Rho termination protein [Deltaproteobacteria bacterium CG_4_8_14_3_um_filter_51_11]PIY26663.1 MAG: Rho termination protein [Deltaproteobacteria bacterium CG_4_10_14_3_um_filter_51_14]PJB39415.1 MAG: Rho termination protein [Delt